MQAPSTLSELTNQDFIKQSIPGWLTSAPADRRLALAAVKPVIPDWYRSATHASHKALKEAIQRSWISQTQVDRLFERLGDVRKFAEPLLHQALKNQFGLELDVSKTYLRLYMPKGFPVAYEIKTLSMLDAALYNFEEKETAKNYFDSASCFITEPGSDGRFSVLSIKNRLGIAEFTALCRQLDIGGGYKQQLEALLLPTDGLAKTVLQHKIVTSQQDRFRVAIQLASMKGDIGVDSRARLLAMLAPECNAKIDFNELSILGATMIGIVLFATNLGGSGKVEPLIVYVPDDPDHPLKEYASTADFAIQLIQQLRSASYQRFFARFVGHEQRGAFFLQLNSLLASIKWHPHEPGDARPPWRLTANAKPNLRLHVQAYKGDLWRWLFQRQLDKTLNDGRAMAVPTADEDRKSRWERWDKLEQVATAVAQVAALAAMPFVPFLGEMMLAYTAYQLLDDTFSGILDWAQGRLAEASDHLLSIAQCLAELGAFAVGASAAGKLLSVQPSAFIDSLKIVDVGGGKERLWHPDMRVYARDADLPPGSMPDDRGLHRHRGVRVLPLEGRVYEVESAQEVYRVRHPSRPDAYKPQLAHNGAGAWALEVENPMQWQGAQLFRRLGHSVAEFSDVTAGRILEVSGIDEAVLRDLHVHSRRPPALLDDTVRRFKRDEQIQAFVAQMQSTDPAIYAKADPQMQRTVLRSMGVDVPEDKLSDSPVQQVIESLEQIALKKLLDESQAFGDPLPALDVQATRLRGVMARWADNHRVDLFKAEEQAFELSNDATTVRMRRIFPDLPKTIAQEISRNASAADHLHMRNHLGITRQMAHEALFYLREVRLSRACEGLYLDAVASPDIDRLALHRLETLDGWPPQIRIEVRDQTFDGALLDSIGDPQASVRKVLVRQNGQYQTYDSGGEQLHGLDDVYGAVQHALPDAARLKLGLPHVGQGPELKLAVRKQPLLARSELRQLFGQPPLEPGVRSPMALAVGRSGYLLGGGDFVPESVKSIDERLRALYPTVDEEEMTAIRNERLVGDPLLAVARLESEYLTLVNELEMWVADVPSIHPDSGQALSVEETHIQRKRRDQFSQEIQASWSRRLTDNNRFDKERFFSKLDILGSLPTLSAEFSQVREFLLINTSACLKAGNFLQGFPNLKFLTMSGLRLEVFPAEAFRMHDLIVLGLDNCDLQLTAETVEGLAHMDGLVELELDNNPLNLAPYVRHMKNLTDLNFSNSGLKEVPAGLFELEKLRNANLSHNLIVELPEELFEVDDVRTVVYNFRDNPLSEGSVRNIAKYDENSSMDRRVQIYFGEEVELADEGELDSEEESDESGTGSLSDSDDSL